MDETNKNQEKPIPQYQTGQLKAFIELMKNEFGDNPELIRQSVADLNARNREDRRNHFEARQEYIKQVAALRHNSLDGLMDYGLQILKWLFLLNAGSIAVVLTFLSGAKSANGALILSFAPVLKALWPFVLGCILVVFAGAAGFFNLSYSELRYPSAEALHNFLQPTTASWPIAQSQQLNESPIDFYKRFAWKINATRRLAIVLTSGSGLFFVYGVYCVLRAAL
ncbi:MAG TPA: hypothetical protein VHN11_18425 [Xanthobacteraceae bacterium]|jgi:hypothetical protein|nr:hypothetical protein [Xanthobacteraceae bacterium]